MSFLNPGAIGELFTALAFASALVAMVSFLLADQQSDPLEQRSWERMAVGSFLAHIGSVLGIIGTMFFMIYTHRYEYHYVWSHSSNELPVYYMISCFWEGQEGSFLLWSFWHSVLGGILLRKRSEWRNPVLAIVASVELILTSMLLGVYINQSWVSGLFLLMAVLPAVFFAYRYLRERATLPLGGSYQLAGAFLALAFLLLMLRGQLAFGPVFIPSQGVFSLGGAGFWLYSLFFLGFGGLYIAYLLQVRQRSSLPLGEILAGLALLAIAAVGMTFAPEQWKAGSSPFILLKEVFPNEDIYKVNPDFIPTNGSGLNPLLQNYWMVIHPPTLFLGFAATLIPFAYVMAGLIRGQYHEWIRPALPWASFSVMILGIGIIMGGYWAYETLNFGGYWNWDPVENSSLVPWLCGVASLHAMLIYRKTKAYLKLTMLMIISTFLLVLYSTFLTRSGILGDTSVHTFTDLGLSGQLLVLLLVYTAFVVVTMILRWHRIPQREDESKVWSAEFMLFLGTLVFIFSGLVILFATSLPVFNAIFGTDFAPPPNVQLFYYQWNVWFAILFGVISGVGQFLWWRIRGEKSLGDAIFRPFLLTVIASAATLIGLWWADMPFAYDKVFASYIDPAVSPGLGAYLRYGILSIADELLLISALFGLFANLDVLVALLRRNRKGLKVMGGTVVHLGFALMLLGMLFSSGYDEVISTNPFPEDLSSFPEQEKVDNVPLPRGVTRPIMGYQVTYTGKKMAQAPVSKVRILEEGPARFKLAFRDASGETFSSVQPRPPFVKGVPDDHDHSLHAGDPNAPLEGEIDLELIENLLNRDPSAFDPELINNRTQYGLRFTRSGDSTDSFTLWPEAEVNETMGSIISHPARRIYWHRDIYVYTSSLPNPETLKPHFYNIAMQVGDTARVGNVRLWLAEVRNLSGRPEMAQYDAAAAAHIFAFTAQDTLFADPVFFIQGRQPGMIGASIDRLGMELAFVGVQPEKDLVNIQIRQIDPQADFVIIKAIAKPFINLLWLGTFILTAGFLVSIYRRMQESRKARPESNRPGS